MKREDFELLKTNKKKFNNLVPSHDEYLFIKILNDGRIISIVGGLGKFFSMNSKNFLNKKLSDVKKNHILFNDFIEPLFNACIPEASAYQFDFMTKDKKFSCSLYPCLMPGELSSVDIVIRPLKSIAIADIHQYILEESEL
jgi:hypothetical protein